MITLEAAVKHLHNTAQAMEQLAGSHMSESQRAFIEGFKAATIIMDELAKGEETDDSR